MLDKGEKATILFMEKARGREQVFRWPPVIRRSDRETVSCEVVFAGNLQLSPFSTSGRAFVVESPQQLGKLYDQFKAHLVRTYSL